MNGRRFRGAIGWIPSFMSWIKCDAESDVFLTQHLLEKSRTFLQRKMALLHVSAFEPLTAGTFQTVWALGSLCSVTLALQRDWPVEH
jgi:hypothetical protein